MERKEEIVSVDREQLLHEINRLTVKHQEIDGLISQMGECSEEIERLGEEKLRKLIWL